MAKSIGASVMLFHVYNIPVAISETTVMPIVPLDEVTKNAEDKMAELLEKTEHVVSNEVKISTKTSMGDIVDELEEVCKQLKPFAVVMGASGLSGLGRALMGSTTLTAIRQLTCPVLSVPVGKDFGTGIKKIGFACDFRDVVETTPVNEIRDVVKTFNAELHILNVDYKDYSANHNQDTPEQAVLLHNILGDLKAEYHAINNKDVGDGISEFAENNNLDLIIAIPKKHKLLDGLFKSSSTKKLIFHSHIPIMCIHED